MNADQSNVLASKNVRSVYDVIDMMKPSFPCSLVATFALAMISQASAETLVLENGEVVEGTLIRSLVNTVSIRDENANTRLIPVINIQRVEIPTADGGVVSGRFISWSNGTYRLSTEEGEMKVDVADGVAVIPPGGGAVETATASPDTLGTKPEVDLATTTDPTSITAGFIYAGAIDDGGRTFMYERGRLSLAGNALVDGTMKLEVSSEDSGPVESAVDRLIAEGANVVFMTGHNSAASIAESAKRHDDVRFVHCGPFSSTPNIEVVCGRIYQARHLSGIIAGGMTESGLIGYVAAKPSPETIVGINAFTLGVQSIRPDAQILVHWTNSWYAPGEEQRRAEELADRGVDVLTVHQDSPAALQVAERRGIDAIGYQSDMRAFAPSATLTSAVWNWGKMYDQVIDQLNDADIQLRSTWLGLREGVVDLAPLSERVPEELRRLVQQRKREIIDGRFNVFTGPIRDVDGDIRVLDGRVITDESLLSMDYLVDGVIGY